MNHIIFLIRHYCRKQWVEQWRTQHTGRTLQRCISDLKGGEGVWYREMFKRTLWCVCSQRGWKHSRHHCVAFLWSKWRNDPDRRLATEELKTWHWIRWESSGSLRQTGIVGVSKAMKFPLRVPAGPLTHSSREQTWLMACGQHWEECRSKDINKSVNKNVCGHIVYLHCMVSLKWRAHFSLGHHCQCHQLVHCAGLISVWVTLWRCLISDEEDKTAPTCKNGKTIFSVATVLMLHAYIVLNLVSAKKMSLYILKHCVSIFFTTILSWSTLTIRTSHHANYQQVEVNVAQRAGTRHCHLFAQWIWICS